MADSLNPAVNLTDEELDAALAELGAPNPTENETPEEEAAPEAPAEEVAPEAPAEEEPEEEAPAAEDKQPSRREQLRIQDLLRKYPPQPEPTAVQPKAPEGSLDIENDVDADDALKQRLLADRKAAAEAAFEQGRTAGSQERASILFHTRLEIDAPKIESKYPVLDKTSEQFKPALANAINTMYLNNVGYNQANDSVQNPNIRYSDFVEALFELGDEIGTTKVEDAKKNVVKQAAKTGLRPDGAAAKPKLNLNKLPHQMSDEELDAALAQMLPSK